MVSKNLCVVLAVVVGVVVAHDVVPESQRKVWSICHNDSCSCGSSFQDLILCDSDYLYVQPCYCVYFEPELNTTVLGLCIPTCFYVHYHETPRNYYKTTRYSVTNGTMLNHDVCDWFFAHTIMHREGRFCGRCKEGYGLAAYSYHYTTCVPCREYGYRNWLKYFAVALLPLTVFYIMVVVVKCNVPSSRLNGIVFALQCFFSSLQLKALDELVMSNKQVPGLMVSFKFLTSIFGFVNLDFFRALYPDNCLHPKLNILHLLSLDFIVAFYPFFLIFVTYVFVSMYDRNFRILVWAWNQFNRLFKWYKNQSNIKVSLVQTFATFILLSYVKVLGICFDLLAMAKTYDESGSITGRQYVLYDANIEYFSPEHLPFALLAIVTGLLFVFLPFLLLLLYPCGCFHRCLDRFGIRFQALHIFMDAFQGCYCTSPYDMRYFSVVYLLLRFLALWSMNYFASHYYLLFNTFFFLLTAILIGIAKPYRKSIHNSLDLTSVLLLTLVYASCSSFSTSLYINLQQKAWGLSLLICAFVIMFVYSLFVLLYHPKLKCIVLKFLSALHIVRSSRRDVEECLVSRSSEVLVEDRNSYTPLLSANSI